MNVRLTTDTADAEGTAVLQKSERLLQKLMTAAERDVLCEINEQQFRNQMIAIYWVLHNVFGFTAEQIKEFDTACEENFPDINTHPAYYRADIPQKAELEAALGITITPELDFVLMEETEDA